jgi:hypothetical protein
MSFQTLLANLPNEDYSACRMVSGSEQEHELFETLLRNT